MNFIEIIRQFKLGKSTAKSHMKNLIEMAAIDGNFDDVELSLLKNIAKKNGISASQLKSIRESPHTVDFIVPKEDLTKFHQLYDLVHMMIIDKEIHSEEFKLCNLYAVRFGYKRSIIEELIRTIRSNIENNHDPKETYNRVKWMLFEKV